MDTSTLVLAAGDKLCDKTVCEALGRFEATLAAAVRKVHVDVSAFKRGVERRVDEVCRAQGPLYEALQRLTQENLQLRSQLEVLACLMEGLTGRVVDRSALEETAGRGWIPMTSSQETGNISQGSPSTTVPSGLSESGSSGLGSDASSSTSASLSSREPMGDISMSNGHKVVDKMEEENVTAVLENGHDKEVKSAGHSLADVTSPKARSDYLYKSAESLPGQHQEVRSPVSSHAAQQEHPTPVSLAPPYASVSAMSKTSPEVPTTPAPTQSPATPSWAPDAPTQSPAAPTRSSAAPKKLLPPRKVPSPGTDRSLDKFGGLESFGGPNKFGILDRLGGLDKFGGGGERKLQRSQTLPRNLGMQGKRSLFESLAYECDRSKAAGSKHKLQRSQSFNSASNIKAMLLEWCRSKTIGYQNIDIHNFSSSWCDGMAFAALVHSFFPLVFDYNTLNPANHKHNFEVAFTTAEEQADCVRLIEVEDMMVMGSRPDPMCIFTYVQSLYNHLKKFE
ncbi:smoothelin-like protein 2 [Salvelinus namaycush]|uniref:Smoothelin-like protein 2 n=1 Tax=Salvelinus namaycush TaxID=8040 RepID=A0A8U0QJ74_SALNM|nr:smoothelin-like protein 2 [Salvelinus namaycush]